MNCPHCQSANITRNGARPPSKRHLASKIPLSRMWQAFQRTHWHPDGSITYSHGHCFYGNECSYRGDGSASHGADSGKVPLHDSALGTALGTKMC